MEIDKLRELTHAMNSSITLDPELSPHERSYQRELLNDIQDALIEFVEMKKRINDARIVNYHTDEAEYVAEQVLDFVELGDWNASEQEDD